MKPDHCGNCRFWNGHADEGTCHRYPPVMDIPFITVSLARIRHPVAEDVEALTGDADRWILPRTCVYDWCGEHQPKPAE